MSSYGPDPFDAGQREMLHATDALLDRIGSRAPTPEDLDDPLVAALALMAAEIDLDPVPAELTRAAFEPGLTDLRLPGRVPEAGPAGPADSVVDEQTGLVLDLRGVPAGSRPPRVRESATGTEGPEGEPEGRRPRRGVRRERLAPASAIAPPRSLPRARSHPAGSRPEGRRQHRLTPATAFVAVVAALVLGVGVSAAVTGGRSVNPLTGLQQVVAQLTGGRTAEQHDLYGRADRDLTQAKAALDRGDRAGAKARLTDFDALHLESVLTTEDQKALQVRRSAIQHQLDG
jgi:hypothetical protein